jgi:TRAP-type C4-dicarboxylate transport system permease small subunit
MLNLLAEGNVNLKPGIFANAENLTFSGLIAALIRLILVVAAIVFFFMLVIGGVRWILSGGDKSQTEAARGQITAALVGLVIVFAAWAIVSLINVFFGVNIFELNLGGISATG